MIELHVWGPALGLPSIDPECLAAIAYLSSALSNEEWTVIVDTTSAALAPHALPTLHHDSIRKSGYRSIASYISSLPASKNPSPPSGTLEEADTIAFTSFIKSTFSPLLSLSLYISPSNYINITRPLYSTLLPWPTQYAIPPALRTAAETQTAHLGLSSFSLDDESNQRNNPSNSQQPSLPSNTLLKGSAKETVSSLLGRRTEGSAAIRLAALVQAALDPLDELLGDKKYMLGDEMGALDCYALGYLSLGLVEGLPSPWLREGVGRFSKVKAYVERSREQCFGHGKLKWGPSLTGGWADRAAGLWSALPMPEAMSGRVRIINVDDEKTEAEAVSSKGILMPSLTATGAALAAGIAYVIYAGILVSEEPLRSQRARKLDSMGETGAMLAELADQMDMEVQRELAREQQQGLEVDVEVKSEDSGAVKGV